MLNSRGSSKESKLAEACKAIAVHLGSPASWGEGHIQEPWYFKLPGLIFCYSGEQGKPSYIKVSTGEEFEPLFLAVETSPEDSATPLLGRRTITIGEEQYTLVKYMPGEWENQIPELFKTARQIKAAREKLHTFPRYISPEDL